MEIFKLFGSIFIKSEDAEKSLYKINDNASKLPGILGNGIKSAVKWGTAIVTVAGVAGTAMMGFASNAVTAADEVDKMSQKIGLSIEGYQEWAYVMGQNGMEIEKLQSGMKTLVQQMDSASSGTASAMENFERLGVSIYDTNGGLKDQETIMNEVLRALADMENGTEKARLTTELFGKAGTEMMPMLNQGSDAIDKLTERAHELGLIMSEETVKAGVTLGDLMDDVKQSFTQVGVSLGAALFPAIQMIVEMILANIPMINDMVQSMVPILENTLTSIVPMLLQMIQEILPLLLIAIQQIVPELLPLIQEIIPIMTELLLIIIPLLAEFLPNALNQLIPILLWLCDSIQIYVIPAIEMLADWLGPVLADTIESISLAFEGFGKMIRGLFESIVGTVEFYLAIFQGDWQGALDALSRSLGGALKFVVGLIQTVIPGLIVWFKGKWGEIKAFFTNAFTWAKNGFNQAKTFVTTIFTSIYNTIKGKINSAVSFVKNGIDKLKSFFDFDWELPKLKMPHFKIEGSFSLDPPSVPSFGIDWYAKGAVLNKPTAFGMNGNDLMVGGEAGPEAIAPIATLQKYVTDAVASQNAELVDVLYKILAAIISMDGNMGENLREALANTSLDIDRRTFARLVKAVN